jgi:hypothetical protein
MSDVGRYRKVYARIWRHPGFVGLNDGEKALALYILSGPQTNRLGLYGFSIATAAEDLGNSPESLKKRLLKVTGTFGWPFDAVARVVYVPSWWKWNPPENANVLKGNLRDLNEIPPCALVDAFARNIETLPVTLRETFAEGLQQRLPKPSLTQEQYQGSVSGSSMKEPPALSRGISNVSDRSQEFKFASIAREAIKIGNPKGSIDGLIDTFQYVARTEHKLPNIPRADALAAINQALSDSG